MGDRSLKETTVRIPEGLTFDHSPGKGDERSHRAVTRAARHFFETLLEEAPECPERLDAFTHIREAMQKARGALDLQAEIARERTEGMLPNPERSPETRSREKKALRRTKETGKKRRRVRR